MYLECAWGKKSLKSMSKELNREESALVLKACRMGLGSVIDNKDFLIASEVCEILGIDRKTLKNHIEKRGLQGKGRILGKKRYVAIMYDNLIQWLKDNKDHWNATKVDRGALISMGYDVGELNIKYEEDKKKLERTTLSESDIDKIKSMYKEFYTYQDIANKLGKEYSTVKWKLHTLIKSGELEQNTMKERLVRTTNRENYGWTKKQDMILISEFRNGKTLREISEMIGKSYTATKSRNLTLSKRLMKGKAI